MNEKLTIYQKLTKVFGTENQIEEPAFKFNKDELLRTTSRDDYEQSLLQHQQTKYIQDKSTKINQSIYNQSVYYEPNRLSAYYDFESMELTPEISAALDIYSEESCVVGSTEIPLLNGDIISIKKLYDNNVTNFWVYGVDYHSNTIKPSKVEKVIQKGVKKVYKITLDDDSELISTGDHKWLMSDNNWGETEKLTFGDSLKSIYTKLDKKGYEKLSLDGKKYKFTHSIVAECELENQKTEILKNNSNNTNTIVVHHKSFNKHNNDPNELQYMLWNDHQKLHNSLNKERWDNVEFATKMKKIFSETAKKTWKEKGDIISKKYSISIKKYINSLSDSERKEKYGRKNEQNGMYNSKRFGKLNPNYHKHKNHIEDIDENEYINVILNCLGDYRSVLIEKFNLNKISVIAYNKILCKKYKLQRIEDIKFMHNDAFSIKKIKNFISEQKHPKIKRTAYAELNNIKIFELNRFIRKKGYKDWCDLVEHINNHRVVNIEFVGEEIVYDLVNSSVNSSFAVKCNNGMVISHNCTVSERGKMLTIFSESRRIQSLLEDLFYNALDINTNLQMWTRGMVKYGDDFVYLKIDDKKGIVGCQQLPNIEIERIEGNSDDLMTSIQSRSNLDNKELKFNWRNKNIEFQAWEIAHFRLLGDDRKLPYGTSILDKIRSIWKKLLLAEDAMLIYRTTRAPERRVFKVFVGNMDDADIEPYIQRVANKFKRDQVVDQTNGQVDMRYNQMSVDQDFVIPVRDPNASSPIETLPGACVALDTEIPLLDGRTLQLQEIIKEWDGGERNLWVYSCDPLTGKIAPGQITWAGVTRKNTEVMEITLDNNEKLITTPDHKFVHRTKGFVEAQHLSIGDSLMPFYRQEDYIINKKYSKKYEQIWDNDIQDWVFTHRMVANNLNIINKMTFDDEYTLLEHKTIHHMDNNRFNNMPENLIWMNSKDHYLYHQFALWSTPEKAEINRKKISKGVSNYINNLSPEEYANRHERLKQYATLEQIQPMIEWRKNPENNINVGIKISEAYTQERKLNISNKMKENWKDSDYHNKIFTKPQKINFSDKIYDMFVSVFETNLRADLTLDILNNNKEFMNMFNSLNSNIRSSMTNLSEFTLNHVDKMLKQRGFKNFSEWKKHETSSRGYINMKQWKYNVDKLNKQHNIHYNHKIVSIKYLTNYQDTGTITVDGEEKYHNYHTFATKSGVFIKNSNLGEIADIEYIQKKLLAALRIPKAFIGFEESVGDGKNLALMDIRFARTINKVQKSLIQELNKIALIHLYILGFDDELENFTLSLNNPSSQADLLKIEAWKEKITLYKDATSEQSNTGILPVSQTWAKKNILGLSDDEVILDLQQQRIERAIGFELSNTSNVIVRSGIFDKVDKLYGLPEDQRKPPTAVTPDSSGGGGMPALGGDMSAIPETPIMDAGEPLSESNIELNEEQKINLRDLFDINKAQRDIYEMNKIITKIIND